MNTNEISSETLDPMEFRRALGLFPTGVAVVTADGQPGHGDVGMTITSFNSVSLDPPLVLFSIGKKALSLPALCAAKTYSINVLGEEHQIISGRFAKAGSDKWAGVEVDRYDDLPFTLRASMVSFQCEAYAEYEGGDHLIFVGRVLRIRKNEFDKPLVFFGGNYASLNLGGVSAG